MEKTNGGHMEAGFTIGASRDYVMENLGKLRTGKMLSRYANAVSGDAGSFGSRALS